MRQNDQFPPPNLSAGCGFSKQTLAGARGNDEVAPDRGHSLDVDRPAQVDPKATFMPSPVDDRGGRQPDIQQRLHLL
jgi:hypothetical protein